MEQRIIVMAMMAAEDCTHRVSTVPITRKNSELKKFGSLKRAKNELMEALAPGSCTTAKPVSLRVVRPRKRKPTPNRNSPSTRFLFRYTRMIPMKNAG